MSKRIFDPLRVILLQPVLSMDLNSSPARMCVRSHCMLILLENGMDRNVSFCDFRTSFSKRIFYTPATLSCYSQFLS